MDWNIVTGSKTETRALGKALAPYLKRGDVILLKGDLGAGKTTFTGGVAEGLGIQEPIISPTFNIMKCYFKGRIPLYHIDAYRLEKQNTEIGLDECIEGDGACLIEWPMYIEKLIPDEYLDVVIKHQGEDKRSLSIHAVGKHYEELLEQWKEAVR